MLHRVDLAWSERIASVSTGGIFFLTITSILPLGLYSQPLPCRSLPSRACVHDCMGKQQNRLRIQASSTQACNILREWQLHACLARLIIKAYDSSLDWLHQWLHKRSLFTNNFELCILQYLWKYGLRVIIFIKCYLLNLTFYCLPLYLKPKHQKDVYHIFILSSIPPPLPLTISIWYFMETVAWLYFHVHVGG